MTGILAIDTSADACSVAVQVDGECRQLFELIPRQHSQRLFAMLRELLPTGNLRSHGIEAIAYGCGPGSFTGLRIAASAVQGLAFAQNVPAVPVSSLLAQAQGALRQQLVTSTDRVLSTLDARINELYWAICEYRQGLAVFCEGPAVCSPADLHPERCEGQPLHLVGSGAHYRGEFSAIDLTPTSKGAEALTPSAEDVIPLALQSLARGEIQTASQVQPIYVRDEITWKKLDEQGQTN